MKKTIILPCLFISLIVQELYATEKPSVTMQKQDEMLQSHTNKPPYSLRSSYRELSHAQVVKMPDMSRQPRAYPTKGFYSTIIHDYVSEAINGDRVVIDNATGLMWHQSGSDNFKSWRQVKKWIKKINSHEYAGFSDWRLPTMEEAASLLESSRLNGNLFISPVFSNKQRWIWTGDKKDDSDDMWDVRFNDGRIYWNNINFRISYVRPVRSIY